MKRSNTQRREGENWRSTTEHRRLRERAWAPTNAVVGASLARSDRKQMKCVVRYDFGLVY